MTDAEPDTGAARAPSAGGHARALATVSSALMPSGAATRAPNEPVVVVLGMHRSGTSLLSNVLHYLGVDMADETDRGSETNKGGFWERRDLVALHDEILEALGRPVASPLHCLPFPPGWWRDKAILPFRKRLREYLEEHRGHDSRWWGFKDPRTCRLLPLWRDLFSQMDIEARYVWAIRPPGEAAASMAAKNPELRPMSAAQAEIMWLAYNYEILRHARMLRPLIVSYNDWFDDPSAVARRLTFGLALPGFAIEREMDECVGSIIHQSYRHYHEHELRSPATSLAQDFYDDIVSLPRSSDSRIDDVIEKYDARLSALFGIITPFVELLREVPKLHKQLREAKAQVEEGSKLSKLSKYDSPTPSETAVLKDHIDTLSNVVQREQNALELQQAELADCRQRIRALEDELATTRREAEQEAERHRTELADLNQRSAAFDAALASAKREAELAQNSLRDREASHEMALVARTAALQESVDEYKAAVAKLTRDLGAERAREGETAKKLQALQKQLRDNEHQRQELEIACEGYLARIEALKSAQRSPERQRTRP
jgi:hypothetical protein